jgi:hypothetical protein
MNVLPDTYDATGLAGVAVVEHVGCVVNTAAVSPAVKPVILSGAERSGFAAVRAVRRPHRHRELDRIDSKSAGGVRKGVVGGRTAGAVHRVGTHRARDVMPLLVDRRHRESRRYRVDDCDQNSQALRSGRLTSRSCGLARRTGRFPQLAHPGSCVNRPVLEDLESQSGRGFMVQARFAGDGSIYLRRQ